MPNDHQAIHEMIMEAHQKALEQAIDRSIRTGVPLVVQENGEIKEIKPAYKYIRVPIETPDTQ